VGVNFLEGRNADLWHEVTDRINLGEMPPEKEPQPDPKAAFAVVEWIGGELKRAEHEARVAGGRSLMRRLNRDEYANTVRDLLHLDNEFAKQVRDQLPADGKAEGFDRMASALFFDETQMEQYIAVADAIARRAIQDAPPEVKKDEFVKAAALKYPKETYNVPNIKTKTPVALGYIPFWLRDGGVELWSQGNYDHNKTGFGFMQGPIINSALYGVEKVVTQDGYYRLRIKAGGFPGERGEPIRLRLTWAANSPNESKHYVEIKGTLDQPEVVETTVFLRAGVGEQKPSMAIAWNGFTTMINNPEEGKLQREQNENTRALEKALAAHAPESELAPLREKGAALVENMYNNYHGPSQIPDPQYDLAKAPRLFLQSIEVEGPIVEWPPAGHAMMGLEDTTRADASGASAVFTQLLPRAYRRPAEPEEIERLVRVVTGAMEKHRLPFRDALRMGLQTMLCSPGFTYLQEPKREESGQDPRPLNGYELANRLSYFLWSTMPDDELFGLAANGQLKNPEILRAQITRMLASPKTRQFVENFSGQWLGVREYGSVKPDPKEYNAYDRDLELAEIEEPLAFFQEVLTKNLPITNFLDSDFITVNERLARHYGIKDAKGDEFRVVPIGPEAHRGGVLGMAGLLTLLADGARTLPVRRAAWVRSQMLDDPPLPPPPNAGAIQPNAAGQRLTVRERLERHRNEPNCASCHDKLDSYGLALENYDAIGAWRTKQNGEGIRGGSAPVIDPSGALKSGREFHDLAGYKSALLAEKDKFARAFATKMLTYALCRPVGYVDHETVDKITNAVAADGYRIQTLVLAIAASEPFQSR
jgi:Protein of unknown function (DUF1592)/Protein of unknown function (DUF1588)/Protein of unknown function (DUF1585)/Protein of unknown function (DUF1587)/Protein of unknown function (DUF1595)